MVNPLAAIPSFMAITDGDLRRYRRRVALYAGAGTAAILTLFLLAGNYLFQFFGITVPAFQIMGGIIFFTNALRTLVEDEKRIKNLGGRKRKEDHLAEAIEMRDEQDPLGVAIVPLAIPMLSGPGAITSTMVLVNLYKTMPQRLALMVAIGAVGVVSWLTLLAAVPLSRFVSERARAVFAKIMALLLGAIGVQFVLNAIETLTKGS